MGILLLADACEDPKAEFIEPQGGGFTDSTGCSCYYYRTCV
jgi:hypothetical protein